MMKRFTLSEIQSMPVIEQGYHDNLLLWHPCGVKVWVSRLTMEDGMPCDNQITVERFIDGCWTIVDTYRPV